MPQVMLIYDAPLINVKNNEESSTMTNSTRTIGLCMNLDNAWVKILAIALFYYSIRLFIFHYLIIHCCICVYGNNECLAKI